MRPNIFDHAPSELSQDAAIAWLLAWGDSTCAAIDPELYRNSHRMLARFFALHGRSVPERIETIEIFTQSNNIDILCVINGSHPIIIEDKTGSSEHSGQLARYVKELSGRDYMPDRILPIYFKTHEQSTFAGVEKDGYKAFTRSDLLAILRACRSSSDIFSDFREKMEALESSFASYGTLPFAQWHDQSWMGFYQDLQREFRLTGECWRKVSNPAGGFLGFWWGWVEDDEFGCGVYMQLEQAKFCFKLGDVEADWSKVRQKWHGIFAREAATHGFEVDKPRFRSGTYMTFATLRGDYRISDAGGLIDLPRTFALIRMIEAGFKSIISHANKTYQNDAQRVFARNAQGKLRELGEVLHGGSCPTSVDQWTADDLLVHDVTVGGNFIGIHTGVGSEGWKVEVFSRENPRADIRCREDAPSGCFDFLGETLPSLESTQFGYVFQRLPLDAPLPEVAKCVERLLGLCLAEQSPQP